MGQTFQENGGIVHGPNAFARWRICCDGEFAKLDRAVDDPVAYSGTDHYYTKQDFFVYVARKYNGGSFSYLDQLYEYMAYATYGQYKEPQGTLPPLYRKAMEECFMNLFRKGLSDVYHDYVLDRAIRHPELVLFRPSEKTDFKKDQLTYELFNFGGDGAWTMFPEEQEIVALSAPRSPLA